jgi:integrase
MKSNQLVNSKSPWNKGKLIGQKPPLKLHEIWSIRIRLEMANRIRDLALFNLAIDSKLRSCDLVKLRVSDIAHGSHILKRSMVMQQKTQSPVQFEITQKTRTALTHLIEEANLSGSDYLFKGQTNSKGHISTRQYARIVKRWIAEIGLNPLVSGVNYLGRSATTMMAG